MSLYAQTPTQPSKEYVYLGSRLIVTEEPSNSAIPVPPPVGLVSWWPAEGNANDAVSTNHGTLMNGAAVTSGKVGQAFSFDGSNDYVDLPSMNVGTSFSLEFWVFPAVSSCQNVIANAYNSPANFGALLFCSDHLEYLQASVTRVSTPAGSVPLNTWSHIALAHDGGVTRLYVNGVLKGTSSQYTTSFNNPLRLGYTLYAYYGYFKGLLDEVSLYNRALSVDEILALFNADSGGKAKNQFSIDTRGLPATFAGQTVSHQIKTLFGTLPIVFTLSGGSLPTGLSLNQDGVLSGVPASSGSFIFNVLATDVTNKTATGTISKTVLVCPPSGLVSWWPGDNNGNDLVGTNAGIINGTTFALGMVNQGFSFDGVNDFVEIPSMNLGSVFSLEFWIYPTLSSGYQHLVSNHYTSISNFGALYFLTNRVVFWQSGSIKASTLPGTVGLNTWSHIVFTYDGSVARIYVNGYVWTTSSPLTMTFNNGLKFGSSIPHSDNYFKGMLDEVSIYNRVLTPDEVQAIVYSGSQGKCAP